MPTKVIQRSCPLCGKTLSDSGPSLRPIGVKIGNAPPGRPQSGLSNACIVYEYLTEGGISRFLALYHCDATEVIGPVRSMRMVDIDIVPQYQAIFAFVGSSQRVARALAESSLLDLNQFNYPGAYYRVSQRRAPYNTYTSIQLLREAASTNGWDSPVSLQGGVFSSAIPSDAPSVKTITIPYPHSSAAGYKYDAERGSYLRFQQYAPQIDANDGLQIEVANVVVQHVRLWATDFIEDAGGAPSLHIEVIGEGKAEVFRDGKYIPGRWEQKSATQRTQYLDEMGRPIPLKPGNTWISLIPSGMEIGKAD
ncbi:MAG: DUF3048 domain-containing protein [Chloroflexota bacterium]